MSRIEAIQHLLAQNPNDPDLYLMLANDLKGERRYGEAADALRSYLALMPPTADVGAAYRDLGICLDGTGEKDAARESYVKGIEAARSYRHQGLQTEIEDLLKGLA